MFSQPSLSKYDGITRAQWEAEAARIFVAIGQDRAPAAEPAGDCGYVRGAGFYG